MVHFPNPTGRMVFLSNGTGSGPVGVGCLAYVNTSRARRLTLSSGAKRRTNDDLASARTDVAKLICGHRVIAGTDGPADSAALQEKVTGARADRLERLGVISTLHSR